MSYNIGDAVYLRDSAALGFLEAYWIQSIQQLPSIGTLYTLATSLGKPTLTATIGDRVNNRTALPLQVKESELCRLCEALALCRVNLESQLLRIISLQEDHGCVGSTDQ